MPNELDMCAQLRNLEYPIAHEAAEEIERLEKALTEVARTVCHECEAPDMAIAALERNND